MTKVLRVFLFAIHSHPHSFALRFLFLQTLATFIVVNKESHFFFVVKLPVHIERLLKKVLLTATFLYLAPLTPAASIGMRPPALYGRRKERG
jgi:hypothetical protein